MKNPTLDAGIPLLTEIIPVSPAELVEETPSAVAEAASPEDAVTLQMRAVDQLDDEQWDRLEREIRERVLYQVMERIDFVLEQRVRDSLADALQTAVERLASDIRGGLHQTVKDVITRAVAQEITKLQATRK